MFYGNPTLSIASDGRGFLFSPQAGGIYHTPDFGRSWTPVQSRYNPYDNAALTSDIHQSGLGLVGFEDGIAITSDSGQTWRSVGASERVEAVRIFSNTLAYAVYKGSRGRTTGDAGNTWNEFSFGLNGAAQLRFDENERCYILLSNIVPDPTIMDDEIRRVAFQISNYVGADTRSPEDNWFLAQRETSTRCALIRSDDRGRTWMVEMEFYGRYPSIDVRGESVVILVSQTIRFRRRPGAPWEVRPAPDAGNLYLLSDVTWICEGYNYLFKTDDAGQDWEKNYGPPGNGARVGCVVSETRVFAIGGNYSGTFSIAETADAGATWTTIHVLPPSERHTFM